MVLLKSNAIYFYVTQIPLVVDRPVGQNLQDHVTSFMSSFIINASLTFDPVRDVNAKTLGDFMGEGKGPLSHTHIVTTAYFTSQYAKDSGEGHWPDLQVVFLDLSMTHNNPVHAETIFNLNPGVLQKYFRDTIGKGNDSFVAIVLVGRPKSRGEVLLDKANLFGNPIINPRYYSDPADMQRLVEGNIRHMSHVSSMVSLSFIVF